MHVQFLNHHITLLHLSYGLLTILPYTILYRVFVRPLRDIPGPSCAKVSGYWRTWHYFRGSWYYDKLWLHKTYGKVFRIAPNEINFVDKHELKRVCRDGNHVGR